MATHNTNRTVKRLTGDIKLLRCMKTLRRAPSRPFGTNTGSLTPAQKATQEKHDRTWAFTPDKGTPRFFAETLTLDETRRNR
jgi:hypothetical protein